MPHGDLAEQIRFGAKKKSAIRDKINLAASESQSG